MAKDNKQTIIETIIEKEIVVETTKLVKETVVDIFGGKVQFYVEGYANGEKLSATVNGKTQDVEITEGLGIFCSGYSFSQYPVIKIND